MIVMPTALSESVQDKKRTWKLHGPHRFKWQNCQLALRKPEVLCLALLLACWVNSDVSVHFWVLIYLSVKIYWGIEWCRMFLQPLNSDKLATYLLLPKGSHAPIWHALFFLFKKNRNLPSKRAAALCLSHCVQWGSNLWQPGNELLVFSSLCVSKLDIWKVSEPSS